MSTKLKETEDINKEFELEGYTLLTTEYENQKQRLEYICPNGHKRYTTWKNWKRGRRCLACKNQEGKPTINLIKEIFEEEGYTLLSTDYINNKQRLDYICPKGHIHNVSWVEWNINGSRCPYCNGRPVITLDYVKDCMSREGYTLLSKEYKNNKQDLEFVCPNGHTHTTNWAKWNSHKYRCPYCYGNVKKKIGDIKSQFEVEGYTLVSNEYDNCNTKLKLLCPNDHIYEVTWDNWNHSGSRCPRCGLHGSSKEEISIYNFIKEHINEEILIGNYSIIKPKELDIVIPDKKIAIEYCGLYWHSELMGKDRNYHLNKLKLCNEKDYKLITIFGDELKHTQNIVLSRLKNILNIRSSITTIFARKCIIKEISISDTRTFCEENHLQGYTGSSIKLGAYHRDELVSVMTFSKPSLSKGQKGDNEGFWELSRFCSKIDYIIIGIASKLLTYFKNNYKWRQIFSYADRRWSDGNLYRNIGFSEAGVTKSNYWYIRGNCDKRHHRFALRKKPDEPKDITEWELRKAQGWNRIWDCGNLKYVMHNK
jgi:hypothetical protein